MSLISGRGQVWAMWEGSCCVQPRMPTGGKLTVSATPSDGQVCMAIQDTGVGIPTGIDIFEPFVTTKTQGTGLGLTVVRQIVAAHNGTLSYHSVPGEGATLTLVLPTAPPAGT